MKTLLSLIVIIFPLLGWSQDLRKSYESLWSEPVNNETWEPLRLRLEEMKHSSNKNIKIIQSSETPFIIDTFELAPVPLTDLAALVANFHTDIYFSCKAKNIIEKGTLITKLQCLKPNLTEVTTTTHNKISRPLIRVITKWKGSSPKRKKVTHAGCLSDEVFNLTKSTSGQIKNIAILKKKIEKLLVVNNKLLTASMPEEPSGSRSISSFASAEEASTYTDDQKILNGLAKADETKGKIRRIEEERDRLIEQYNLVSLINYFSPRNNYSFLLDTSNSMRGAPEEAMKQAITFVIDYVEENKKVAFMAMTRAGKNIANETVLATNRNQLQYKLSKVRAKDSSNGDNIIHPLKEALGDKDTDEIFIFGDAGFEEGDDVNLSFANSATKKIHFYCINCGISDKNRLEVQRITAISGGSYKEVSTSRLDPVRAKMLLEKIEAKQKELMELKQKLDLTINE